MIFVAKSRHGISIRLTDERWLHIVEEHSELAGMLESVLDAVELADTVYEGSLGEKLASRRLEVENIWLWSTVKPMQVMDLLSRLF